MKPFSGKLGGSYSIWTTLRLDGDEVEAVTGVYVMVSPQVRTPSLRYRHEFHLLWKRRTDDDFLLDFFARLDLPLVHVLPHHRVLLGRDHNGLCERWACSKDANRRRDANYT